SDGGGAPRARRCAGGATFFSRRYPLVRKPSGTFAANGKPVDFMRGPAEMADAIRARRTPRLSPQLGAHIVELIEAMQYPDRFGFRKTLTTTFSPIEPMSWAT